jgi:hypothetical protein
MIVACVNGKDMTVRGHERIGSLGGFFLIPHIIFLLFFPFPPKIFRYIDLDMGIIYYVPRVALYAFRDNAPLSWDAWIGELHGYLRCPTFHGRLENQR